ncbi:MAG: purine-nucleoside phosphorylase [Ktedonobacterales bacterium]|nr:purine-nucleoside phosphorylase [Ktedonobacterales bacterium]
MGEASPSPDLYAQAREAADFVAGQSAEAPRIALILGTGLGGVAEAITEAITLPFAAIPHFPRATVLGHAGQLVLGRLHGVSVAALQGRFHLYEGYPPGQVTFPVRMLRLLGVDVLMVTNAAGGLDPALSPGSLMLLRDSIGLPLLAGMNPLAGPNDELFGSRFPPMAGAYDITLRHMALEVARELAIPLAEGVYAMVSGPSYETPAELRFLRAVGADAVGMSTVPEVVAALHLGMRVLAISCITNAAPLREASEATPVVELAHADVVAVATAAGERLGAILDGVVRRLAS